MRAERRPQVYESAPVQVSVAVAVAGEWLDHVILSASAGCRAQVSCGRLKVCMIRITMFVVLIATIRSSEDVDETCKCEYNASC